MVKNAMEWAKARNLVRTNPVHGKSEYKVPVLESFSHAETERTTQRAAASAILEDRCWYHLIFYMCFFFSIYKFGRYVSNFSRIHEYVSVCMGVPIQGCSRSSDWTWFRNNIWCSNDVSELHVLDGQCHILITSTCLHGLPDALFPSWATYSFPGLVLVHKTTA